MLPDSLSRVLTGASDLQEKLVIALTKVEDDVHVNTVYGASVSAFLETANQSSCDWEEAEE